MRWCCRVAPLVGAVMWLSGVLMPSDVCGEEHTAAMELPPEYRDELSGMVDGLRAHGSTPSWRRPSPRPVANKVDAR